MNYKVFKIDEPETWPELNCPLLVWKPNIEWPYIFQWDPNGRCFIDNRVAYRPKMCFYKYIGHMPYIEKELHPIKCGFDVWDCPHYDDGYCLYDKKCEHQKEATEYFLELKRIWKEY